DQNAELHTIARQGGEMKQVPDLGTEILRLRLPVKDPWPVVVPLRRDAHFLARNADAVSLVRGPQDVSERGPSRVEHLELGPARPVHRWKVRDIDAVFGDLLKMHAHLVLDPPRRGPPVVRELDDLEVRRRRIRVKPREHGTVLFDDWIAADTGL